MTFVCFPTQHQTPSEQRSPVLNRGLLNLRFSGCENYYFSTDIKVAKLENKKAFSTSEKARIRVYSTKTEFALLVDTTPFQKGGKMILT